MGVYLPIGVYGSIDVLYPLYPPSPHTPPLVRMGLGVLPHYRSVRVNSYSTGGGGTGTGPRGLVRWCGPRAGGPTLIPVYTRTSVPTGTPVHSPVPQHRLVHSILMDRSPAGDEYTVLEGKWPPEGSTTTRRGRGYRLQVHLQPPCSDLHTPYPPVYTSGYSLPPSTRPVLIGQSVLPGTTVP